MKKLMFTIKSLWCRIMCCINVQWIGVTLSRFEFQNFGSSLKISSIQINMYFKRQNEEYFLENMVRKILM